MACGSCRYSIACRTFMSDPAMAAGSGSEAHPARTAFTRSSPVEAEKSAHVHQHGRLRAMARWMRAMTFPAPNRHNISCHQHRTLLSPRRRQDVFPPPPSDNIAHFRRDHIAGFETHIPSISHAPRYVLASPAGWPAYRQIIHRSARTGAQHDDGRDFGASDAKRVQAVSFL